MESRNVVALGTWCEQRSIWAGFADMIFAVSESGGAAR
jgi:hypothetical protein